MANYDWKWSLLLLWMINLEWKGLSPRRETLPWRRPWQPASAFAILCIAYVAWRFWWGAQISQDREIFSPKQNQNIKDLLTGRALLILNIQPENKAIVLSLNRKWLIAVFFMGEMLWLWILSTVFDKSMIFTVFSLAKEEMSSSKTCVIVILP